VHTTSPSYLAEEVKATVSRQLSAAFATDYKLPDLLQEEPSPILVKREGEKRLKYSRLTVIAERQFKDGRRSKAPSFVPFVVADSGELRPLLFTYRNG
jgi:hypothetical protein